MKHYTRDTYLAVRKVISSVLNIREEEIMPESHVRDGLGADSVDLMDIIVRLEKEFGLKVPDNFDPQIDTVGDIIKLVEEIQNKGT